MASAAGTTFANVSAMAPRPAAMSFPAFMIVLPESISQADGSLGSYTGVPFGAVVFLGLAQDSP